MRKMTYYAYYADEDENSIRLYFAVASNNYAQLRDLLRLRKNSKFIIVNWKKKVAQRYDIYLGIAIANPWKSLSNLSKPMVGLSK